MEDNEIEIEIKKSLQNEGYGPTAALLHTNELTKAIFRWAYDLGQQDAQEKQLQGQPH